MQSGACVSLSSLISVGLRGSSPMGALPPRGAAGGPVWCPQRLWGQGGTCQGCVSSLCWLSPCPLPPPAENLSAEVSLLELIGDPPPEEILKIYGPDNNPGYVFGPNANTGQVARYHLPSPFYRDFSLLFHIQPTTPRAGVLFAVTDSSQSIIYVGVKLSDLQAGKQRIIFYYTEPGSPSSYAAATFTVPTLLNQWTRFAISVEEDEVVLYLDCEEYERVRFERSPDEMELEQGSGLFVAQAGGADPDKYQVRRPWVTPTRSCQGGGQLDVTPANWIPRQKAMGPRRGIHRTPWLFQQHAESL